MAVAAAALVVPIAFPGLAELAGSQFDAGDGNQTLTDVASFGTNDNDVKDWENAPALQSGTDLASGQDDDSLGQGTKEDTAVPSVVDGSIPNNKSDLLKFYVSNEKVGLANFLYLGWRRDNTLGTANMDFEFNQKQCTPGQNPADADCTSNGITPVRTAGDMLITFDFSSGGNNVDLGLSRWITGSSQGACEANGATPPCWKEVTDLDAAGVAEGGVNDGFSITNVLESSPASIESNRFGEAGVNLTAAGVFPAGTCFGFGGAYLKSRASDSFTAAVKDFIAPIPVNINNCGTVVVNKTGVGGAALDGATFTLFTDNPPLGGTRGPASGAGADPATSFSCTTGVANSDGSVPSTGTCSMFLVPLGDYWLVETTTPNGYQTVADQAFSLTTGGQVRTFNIADPPVPGRIDIVKQDDDDPAARLPGATFQLYADSSPFGPASPGGGTQTSPGAEDTAVAGKTCTTDSNGTCSITSVALGRYWVVETVTPSGYATAAPQNVVIGLGSAPNQGQTVSLTFTDPRLFKVIVIVCQKSNNQLYPSKVSFDGAALPATPNSLGPGGGGTITDAQLCALGGATHDDVQRGSHSASVNIPQ